MSCGLPFESTVKIISKLKSSQQERKKLKISTFTKSNRSLVFTERRIVRSKENDRFKKNNNLVENNKLNFQRMALSTAPVQDRSPRSSSKVLNNRNNFSLLPVTKEELLGSRAKDLFVSHRKQAYQNKQLSSQNLEYILGKNRMKKPRNLLSYNILRLQRKYNFSRFELHTLYSMFHTLLSDSKQSLGRFKRGFEVIFNMNKIAIRPETLQKIFAEQRSIDFQNFIDMYSRIDQNIYQQSIVDYVEILFESLYNKDKISFEDVVRLMRNRITEKESIDIAKIIFEQIDRAEDETVKLEEIEELCHKSESFAKKMYRLYTRQCKND